MLRFRCDSIDHLADSYARYVIIQPLSGLNRTVIRKKLGFTRRISSRIRSMHLVAMYCTAHCIYSQIIQKAPLFQHLPSLRDCTKCLITVMITAIISNNHSLNDNKIQWNKYMIMSSFILFSLWLHHISRWIHIISLPISYLLPRHCGKYMVSIYLPQWQGS